MSRSTNAVKMTMTDQKGKSILDNLPEHDGPKVIYAAATRLGSSALQRVGIVFKHPPYAIEV